MAGARRLAPWYDKVTDPTNESLSQFRSIEPAHARVHQEAVATLNLFEAGCHKDALGHLAELNEAGNEVFRRLGDLGETAFKCE